MPRIVFMGTPDFAVPSLEACAQLGELVAVVTQPDKPKGRGQQLSTAPVKAKALELGVETIFQPDRVTKSDLAETLRALAPDVAVVTAYGQILPQSVLDAPAKGCLNVHASLLPRYRGAAPIQRAIANGDLETGVCLMKMDAGMDTGPVLSCRAIPIEATDTSVSLHRKLSQLGKQLLLDDLPKYLAGTLTPTPQSSAGVSMAPRVRKEEGLLDFTTSAAVLARNIRAFDPWPGAYTWLDGRLLKVLEAKAKASAPAPAGTILAASAEGISVACGEGALVLTRIQPEGKRAMTAGEFLIGRKLEVGARPFQPSAKRHE